MTDYTVMEYAILGTGKKLEAAKTLSFPQGGPVVGQAYAFICTHVSIDDKKMVARFQLVPVEKAHG